MPYFFAILIFPASDRLYRICIILLSWVMLGNHFVSCRADGALSRMVWSLRWVVCLNRLGVDAVLLKIRSTYEMFVVVDTLCSSVDVYHVF